MEKIQNKTDRRKGSFRNKKQINFGDIVYFPDSLEIIRDSGSCTLTPIPSRILNFLISRPGQYVSRQEITQAAWPPSRVVTEETFYQTIKRLRQFLGDTSEPRQYIVNSRTNHYMLEPAVTIDDGFTPESTGYHPVLKVGFIVLCVAVAWFVFNQLHGGITYQRVEDTAITTIKGQINQAVISPDQSSVVFLHKAPDKQAWNLKAKKLDSEKYVDLVIGKPGVYNTEPDFSPSGKRLSWVMTDYRSLCQLMIADFDSSTLTLSNQEAVLDCAQAYYARSPQWKTKNSLLVALPQGEAQPDAIFEVDLTTKNRIKVTSPIGVGVGDYALFFNSNNNKIAHLRQLDEYDAEVVLMVYDSEFKTDVILKKYSSVQYSVAWFDETRILVKGDNGFEVVSLDGQSVSVDGERIDEENYIFSMGDDRFGFVRGPLYSADINIIDLINHSQSTTKFSSTSHEYRVVIAKESNEVAFSSKRNGYRQIFITIDQIPIQVTDFTTPVLFYDLAISSDGRYVAFESGGYLHVLDNSGALIYKKKVAVSGISFSPDGHSLLFGSEVLTSEKLTSSVIKQLNLSDLSESTLTDGFMPKAVEGGVYFFRIDQQTNQSVLHKINHQGEVMALFESPFSLINSTSTSFDVIDDQLLYVQSNKDKKMLVSRNLITDEITEISPLQTTKFSINKNMTLLVTNPKGQVQNNLAAFTLKISD